MDLINHELRPGLRNVGLRYVGFFTLVATNDPQPLTSNEGTATETFKFGGLRRNTANFEIESFFRQCR